MPCPIHFEEEEIHNCIEEEGEIWNRIQNFWDKAAKVVDREGFSFHECYDHAVLLFKKVREVCKEGMEGKEWEMWDKQTRWVEKHYRTDS